MRPQNQLVDTSRRKKLHQEREKDRSDAGHRCPEVRVCLLRCAGARDCTYEYPYAQQEQKYGDTTEPFTLSCPHTADACDLIGGAAKLRDVRCDAHVIQFKDELLRHCPPSKMPSEPNFAPRYLTTMAAHPQQV